MTSVIAFIGQTLASSALVIAGFIGVRFQLGERFLSHHLEKKIGELKHAHDRDISHCELTLHTCKTAAGERTN